MKKILLVVLAVGVCALWSAYDPPTKAVAYDDLVGPKGITVIN